MVKNKQNKTSKKASQSVASLKDTKRERMLFKMIEKKKKMKMTDQWSFSFKPIKLNWKSRIMRKASFKYMNYWFQYFVDLMNINKIIDAFKVVIFGSPFYHHQTIYEFKKMFSNRFIRYFLSIGTWLIALNIRKDPNWSFGFFIKAALQFFKQYMKIQFFVRWVIYKGRDRKFKQSAQYWKANIPFIRNLKLGFYKNKTPNILRYLRADFILNYFCRFIESWTKKKKYVHEFDYYQGRIQVFKKFIYNTYSQGSHSLSSIKSYNDDLIKYRHYKKRVISPLNEVSKIKALYGFDENLSSMFLVRKKSFIVLQTAMEVKQTGEEPLLK